VRVRTVSTAATATQVVPVEYVAAEVITVVAPEAQDLHQLSVGLSDRYSKYYLKTLIVTNTCLNMRAGPGTGYRIIRKLEEDQLLTFLAMTGSWVKVRIRGGETIGFVHMKYVAVLTD